MNLLARVVRSVVIASLSVQTLLGALVEGESTPSMKTYVDGAEKLVVYTDIPGHATVPADLLINNGTKIQAKIKSDIYGIRVRSAATNNEWVECFTNITYNRATELAGILESMVVTSAYQKPNAGWSQSYANIEMSGVRESNLIPGEQTVSGPGKDFMEIEVEIRKLDGGPMLNNLSVIQKAAVHPQYKILKDSYSLVDGKVYFTITYPGQVVIDINGQMDDHHYAFPSNEPGGAMIGNPPVHSITFFANPILEKPSTGRIVSVAPGSDYNALRNLNPYTFDTMVFQPGVHDIGAGFPVHPKKSYYMPGDAILFGTISNNNLPVFTGPADTKRSDGDNLKLYGYGTLSGVKVPHYNHMGPSSAHPDFIAPNRDYGRSIIVNGGYNFLMDGPTIVDPPSFATSVGGITNSYGDNVNRMRWVKAVTWRQNGDGFGGYHILEDSFGRTADDTTYLHNDRIRCTFWKDNNANIFRLIDLPYPSPTPIRIEDCDIVYSRTRSNVGDLGNVFSFGVDNRPTVPKKTNVLVKDVRFHDKQNSMKVFVISGCQSYTGIKFENIQAKGTRVVDPVKKKQIFTGSAEAPYFGGVIFKDVYFKNLDDTDPASKGVKLTAANFNTYFETNEFAKYQLFDDPRTGFTLNLNSNPALGGTITKSPDKPSYIEAEPVKLTAVAKYGNYVFSHWSGDASGSQNPLAVYMMDHKTITANYVPAVIENPVTIQFPTSGSWTVPPGVFSLTVQAWGGGGAGGSSQAGEHTFGNEQVRAGGAAGGSYASQTLAVTPGDLIEFTLGAGGTGATVGHTNLTYGMSGGESLVKIRGTTIVRALGGQGGQNVNNTFVAGKYINGLPGIAPTTGNIGSTVFYGGNGALPGSTGTGGGGGSAGSQGKGGNAGIPNSPEPGLAGLGGGAAGAPGHNDTGDGRHALSPGGGGSAAGIRNGAYTHRMGGNGGDGKIIITYAPNPTEYFENSGGSEYTATDGSYYSANTGANVSTTTQAIAGTEDDPLYQSERYADSLNYSIPLANGAYQVTLMFAEIQHNDSGMRSFNVNLEGMPVITNLDIFSKVGKNTAYNEIHNTTVTDGVLNIDFIKNIDSATISAIRILPFHTLSTSAPNGSIYSIPSSGAHVHGNSVAVTAVPDPGYRFIGWSGDLSGNSNPSNIVMDANKSIIANFEILLPTEYRVNCGGDAYTVVGDGVYVADNTPPGGSTTAAIANTNDDALYQSERVAKSLSYNTPLENGVYQVTLMFAETAHNTVGRRVFSVSLEGTLVIADLDIFSRVGKNTAYNETHLVTVSDRQLNIACTTRTDYAKFSAIRVVPDPFTAWAGAGGNFNDDANNDGVANGLAWLLGATSPSVNATVSPAVSRAGGDLVLDFACRKIANRSTAALKLQYSADLGVNDPWAGHEVAVPDGAATVGAVTFSVPSVNPDPNLVNLRATIPASAAAPGTTLFARLKGVR